MGGTGIDLLFSAIVERVVDELFERSGSAGCIALTEVALDAGTALLDFVGVLARLGVSAWTVFTDSNSALQAIATKLSITNLLPVLYFENASFVLDELFLLNMRD